MTYKELIERERKQYIGKKVRFCDSVYTVVDVDYNGALLINKKAEYTETTAVSRFQVEFE